MSNTQVFSFFAWTALLVPGVFFVGFGHGFTKPPISTAAAILFGVGVAAGLLLLYMEMFPPLLAMALIVPGFQYLAFRFLYGAFNKFIGRYPETAVFNFSRGRSWDRAFNLLFLIVGVLFPIFSVAYIFGITK